MDFWRRHLRETRPLGELVRRYRNQITNYIYRMTNDYETAVDLAQEAVRVFAAAERYQTTYAFSTYIYRIATNLAISELRRRKRRRLVSLTGYFQGRDAAPAELVELDVADARPLRMSRSSIKKDARRWLGQSRRFQKNIVPPFVLRDVEERSYDEIAAILEMSEGTVKSRINRARSFLRDKLRGHL